MADRTCTKCRSQKPESEFYKNKGKPLTHCKSCVKKRTLAHYKKNRSYYTERRYWSRVRLVYGISQKDVEAMLEKQENKCAICKNLFGKDRRPSVDHCHKTGKVRGILCDSCNVGLGHFKDDLKLLVSAMRYLLCQIGSSK